jgi:hypothetical protein
MSNLLRYIQKKNFTTYTAVIMLCDRSNFFDGNILVRKDTRNNDRQSSDEDHGDDEGNKQEHDMHGVAVTSVDDSGSTEGDSALPLVSGNEENVHAPLVKLHSLSQAHSQSQSHSQSETIPVVVKKPRFSALTTEIARLTPEKGGMLLIQSNREHGIQSVTRGRMDVLVLELWPFEDADVGVKMGSAEGAKPIKTTARKEEL